MSGAKRPNFAPKGYGMSAGAERPLEGMSGAKRPKGAPRGYGTLGAKRPRQLWGSEVGAKAVWSILWSM